MCIEPPLPFAIPPLLPENYKGLFKKKFSSKNEKRLIYKSYTIKAAQRDRLTCEFSHDLLYSPSSSICVAMGAIGSDQVVCQINRCFNTNGTGFLPGLGENISLSYTCGHQVRLSMCQPLGGCVQFRGVKKTTLLTWPSYKWQNPLIIFCL